LAFPQKLEMMFENLFNIIVTPLIVVEKISLKIAFYNKSFANKFNIIDFSNTFTILSNIFYTENNGNLKQRLLEATKNDSTISLFLHNNPQTVKHIFNVSTLREKGEEYIVLQYLNETNLQLTKERNKYYNIECELLKKLVKLCNVWIIIANANDNKILKINNIGASKLEIDSSLFVGKPLNALPIKHGNELLKKILYELKKNKIYVIENEIITSTNGKSFLGNLFCELINTNKTQYIFLSFFDCTYIENEHEIISKFRLKFSTIFRLSPNWIALCRLSDGMLIDSNEGFLQGLGLEKNKAVGRSIYDLNIIPENNIFKEWVSKFQNDINAVIKDIFEFKTVSGSIRRGFITIAPIKLGNIPFFTIIFDDRTVYVRLQEMLFEREESYQSMLENYVAGFYRIQIETGEIIECNSYLAKILGYQRHEDIVGLNLFEMLAGKDDYANFMNSLIDEEHITQEIKLTQPNGKEIWVSNYAKIFQPGNYIEGIMVDITNQKKLDKLLVQRENLYRKLIENTNDLIFIIDEQGKCLFQSPSVNKTLDFNIRHKVKSLLDIICHSDHKKVISFVKGLQSSRNTTKTIDIQIQTNNGQIKIYNLKANNLSSIQDIGGIVITATDVTEKIEVQNKIEQMLHKEQELNRQKNIFISSVSHEFRTPLTNIFLNLHLLSKYIEENDNESAKRNIDRIENSSKRLNSLVNEVSLISREQSGHLIFSPEKLTTTQLVNFIVEQLNYLFQNNVKTQFKIGTEQYVYADKTLILHVIDNILNNAIKFSPQKSIIKFNISINQGQLLNVKVKDNGIGIPIEEQKFLFNPYFRASNVENINGSGLGLSIVKRCIDLHKGEIEIKSKIGKGTEVNVIIPLLANKDS